MLPNCNGKGNGTKGLALKELSAMLEAALKQQAVSLPRDKFSAVVTLALQASQNRQSSAFSVPELETMLEGSSDEPLVTMQADEFRHLVALAMRCARVE